MKWYTCLNEAGLRTNGECLLAACNSCLRETSLVPHILYAGPANAFTEHLQSLGVKVLFRELSFAADLRDVPPMTGFDRRWAEAVFLRFDVALLEDEDRYVLYADSDVLFCREFDFPPEGAPVYAADEVLMDKLLETPQVFNAGVMVLNVSFFKHIHPTLVATALSVARGECALPWYDQGVLNAVLGGVRKRLGREYNFRPYFGEVQEPYIVHFQFLKPAQIFNYLSGRRSENVEVDLYRASQATYDKYVERYKSYLDGPGIQALRRACPDALLSMEVARRGIEGTEQPIVHGEGSVFILGPARSGTSVMFLALRKVFGLAGLGESHVPQIFQRMLHQFYQYVLQFSQRDGVLAQRLHVPAFQENLIGFLRRFYVEQFGGRPFVDKTPGLEALVGAPFLREVFPGAKVVVMERNGIETIDSYRRKFETSFEAALNVWTQCTRETAKLKVKLPDALFLSQNELRREPEVVATQLAEYLGRPQRAPELAWFFRQSRGDVTSAADSWRQEMTIDKVNWTDAEKEAFRLALNPTDPER